MSNVQRSATTTQISGLPRLAPALSASHSSVVAVLSNDPIGGPYRVRCCDRKNLRLAIPELSSLGVGDGEMNVRIPLFVRIYASGNAFSNSGPCSRVAQIGMMIRHYTLYITLN